MGLHVDQRGSGPPLVILPSFTLAAPAMATAFEPALGPSPSWRRLYVDLPGTGASPAVEPTTDAVLEAVTATIAEHLGGERFALAGWSYGGYLALELARRRSTQVAGVLLVCTGERIRPADRDLTGVLPSSPQAGWLDRVDPALHRHFEVSIGLQTREVAERVAAVLAANPPSDDGYLTSLRTHGFALANEGGREPVAVPACLVGGRSDRVAGHRGVLALLDRFPLGDVALLAEAGHYLPVEFPQQFGAITQHWLERCRAANADGG